MQYELWDSETENMIDFFEDEKSALAYVNVLVEQPGYRRGANLSLVLYRPNDDSVVIADDEVLARRASAILAA